MKSATARNFKLKQQGVIILTMVKYFEKSVVLFKLICLSLFAVINFAVLTDAQTCAGAELIVHGSDAKVSIEIQDNKMVGLLRFMYAISDIGNASKSMKAIYEFKRDDKSGDVQYIKKFKNLFNELPPTVNIFGCETSSSELFHKVRYMTPVAIQHMAAGSSDENNFKFLLSGVLEGKYLNEFFDCVNYFMPIYDKIFYEPSIKAGFKNLVKEKNKRSPGFKNLVSRIYSFYDLSMAETHIKVILVPLYIEKEDYMRYKNSNFSLECESGGNFQIVETVVPEPPKNDKNYEWSTAIHEITHFFQMNSNNIEAFNAEIIDADAEYGTMCQSFSDDAIATAIQVYSTKPCENSSIFKTEWYNNSVVDGFAKSIYKIIAVYIDSGKPLDKELAIKITTVFKEKFKDASKMYEVLFHRLNVFAAKYGNANCMQIIFRSLPCDCTNMLKIQDGETAADEKNTNLFIIRKDEVESLSPFKTVNLQKIKDNFKNSENFVCAFFNGKKRKFDFVFVVSDLKNLEPLLKKFNSQKLIEECIINL